MLKADVNDLLTRTSPGTPMGDMFRRYWLPALLAEELPEPDSPPVRVKILSERLIAFRDSEGHYGLIDEFCPHRGASLWEGDVEGTEVSCPWHGARFDLTTGAHLCPPASRGVAAYKVQVVGDEVQVELP